MASRRSRRHQRRLEPNDEAAAPAQASVKPTGEIRRAHVILVVIVGLVLVLVGGGYIVAAAVTRHASAFPGAAAPAPATARQLADILTAPHLVYLRPGADPRFNQLEVAPLDRLDDRVAVGTVACARVYFSNDRGACAGEQGDNIGILGPDLRVASRLPLQGLPSRVRVSPNGRLVAATTFLSGNSYSVGGFSTMTSIDDLVTGSRFYLTSLKVTLDGKQIQNSDFAFWGVTFEQDDNSFYATLGTQAHRYLIHGNLSSGRAQVVRDGVECPSLSPDGKRLVYKSPLPPTNRPEEWRLRSIDLATMHDTVLGETRSVDDQIEWLNNDTILYSLYDAGPPATLDLNIWSLSLSAGSKPIEFLRHATSPAVVRGAA